ncbi:MAG: helix-turn-helix domain-containing protein [Alphaproteobacteria bacterium]|nr:helix-turn-helix domain-containing protein [Alphaproteobacteria bacterium]
MAQELVLEADGFAARLSLALKALNISRSQFSATLGVHKSLVSRWLSGQVMPTSYNLARISAEFAKRQPGFNMTLWTAPRRDFEAVLGLSSTVALPEPGPPQIASAEPVASPAPQPVANTQRWRAVSIGAILLVMVAAGGMLLWKTPPPSTSAPEAPSPAFASVAVLPFLNMSGDPAKEYLGEGISEEILNDLANTPALRVAARTSSFSFKGKPLEIAEIARKLNVRAVLEGSVRQQGDRIRIVAQLIDGRNGFHLWSARYDRSIKDLLSVQDEIARAITQALGQRLVPKRPRAIDPIAYQDYLQAQYFLNQRTPRSVGRADDLLADAIARQPDFAGAYALRGHTLLWSADLDQKSLAESQRMTAEALKLDPNNVEALGTDIERAIRMWDWDSLYRTGQRLLTMKKRNAKAYEGLHFFYLFMGFPNETVDAIREAAELDPLSFPYRHLYELALWHAGRLPEAIAAGETALKLQPSHPRILNELCTLNAHAGNIARAQSYARQLAALPAGGWAWLVKNCELEIAFKTEPRGQIRGRLDAMVPTYIPRADLAVLYARNGDNDKAVTLLQQAYEKRGLDSLTLLPSDADTPRGLLHNRRVKALWQRPELRAWQGYHDRISRDLAATKQGL